MNHLELIKNVEWKDLKKLSMREIFIENNISMPWFFISLSLAYHGYYWLALPFSGFYFLTALRQVHNGFHNSLGTGKLMTWLSLYLNSLTMLTSVHAVKFNHIRHHKFCLSEEDYEGKSASMKWYEAILYGPKHLFLIHWITFKKANKTYRKNMFLELGSIGVMATVIFYFQIHVLMYHTVVMIFGELLMAFFAVWTVHHDTHENPGIARTQRGFWKNKLTFSMFYHMEHHLFPAVPTIKLPELADRIDKKLPELNKKQTF
ncbi:fatty acid desaturase [Chryseobacterium capnotolerans]|uniref:fatty acid desaturase n=1 Tax=Chryseobacterium TaxID=59732 RepID=UPI00083B1443|nr:MULTISPECIES: fatty acid desaturase [Chryseobacterium]UHO39595.1 fatty acid desaturase [Chryseobacterium capnotolerans]